MKSGELRLGELSAGEQLGVAARGLTAATIALPGLLRGTVRLAVYGDVAAAGVAALAVPPDTALTREAAERAAEELAPEVFAHSRRCWQWSVAFAEIDRRDPDLELLFVAAMLHDIALGAPDDLEYGCFAALGGDRAARVVASHRDAEAAARTRDAIAVHFHPETPAEPEAHCLHEAVNLDVVGYRLADVAPDRVAAVERAYARRGFDTVFAEAMRTEADRRPRSAAAVLWKTGARMPMTLNPLGRADRRR